MKLQSCFSHNSWSPQPIICKLLDNTAYLWYETDRIWHKPPPAPGKTLNWKGSYIIYSISKARMACQDVEASAQYYSFNFEGHPEFHLALFCIYLSGTDLQDIYWDLTFWQNRNFGHSHSSVDTVLLKGLLFLTKILFFSKSYRIIR